MQESDTYLRQLDIRFLNSRLADRLKKQGARRLVVIACILGLMAMGYLVGFIVWLVLAPNPATPIEKLLSALFWMGLVMVIQIPPLLIMSIRSAVDWPGEPYDERQQQLHINARSDARPFELGLLGISTITGLVMLSAMSAGYLPFSHPLYGGLPLYIGIGIALLMLAQNAPRLLLAWQLSDDLVDDSGREND